MSGELHLPAGSTAHGRYAVDLPPERAGWEYTALAVLDLPAGATETVPATDRVVLVLPLAGGCVVDVDGARHVLDGRADVFAGPTDCLYVPAGSALTISTAAGARIALPGARAGARLPVASLPAADARTELRGAGPASRLVRNYALDTALRTDRLLVCEVLTPGGGWSSHPPHKHDVHAEDERVLEEVYYYEVAGGPAGPGMAYHRTYGTPERPVDLLVEVRTGDVVLVPHGYHGPVAAVPGYDLYYLNVMAGPARDGAWLATDDPVHAWVRGTWAGQDVDPRLRGTEQR